MSAEGTLDVPSDSPVVPKDSDLTTAARARAIGRIRPKGEEDDTRVDLFVSAASDAVRRYTNRDFLFLTAPDGFDADATSTKTFEYRGGRYLSLGRFEAREIESVTADGQLLDADAWKAQPTVTSVVGTYTYLSDLPLLLGVDLCLNRLPNRTYIGDVGDEFVDVEVVAKWGVVDLPSDVELAVIDAVTAWFSNPQGARLREFEGVSMDDDGGDGYERSALPLRARLLLEPYRRAG